MANEIHWRHTATGSTIYATIRSDGRQYWNTSGTPALETLTVANWADYDIALTESPSGSYLYAGDWPAGLSTAGFYWVDIYQQAGGTPAIGDSLVGTIVGYWNGTTLSPWDARLTSDGLDAIPTTVTGVASTFPQMLVQLWRRFFKKADRDATTIQTYADDDTTVLTEQTISDSGGVETQGAASEPV